jgi:hypothetical protein
LADDHFCRIGRGIFHPFTFEVSIMKRTHEFVVLAPRTIGGYPSAMGPTHLVQGTSMRGDFDFQFTMFAPELIMNSDMLIAAIERNDAATAGLTLEECAGFEMLAFVHAGKREDTAMAIVRTRGLGPNPEDNVLLSVLVTPLEGR